jgi:hypothetical protein
MKLRDIPLGVLINIQSAGRIAGRVAPDAKFR